MMKERHFRVWKKLARASNLIVGGQCISTAKPCVFRSRTISGFTVATTETCCERLLPRFPQAYTERVKFRSRVLRSSITCPNNARLLFTTPSSNAVVHTTTPERNSTTENKANMDLKTKTARKPAATTRRPTKQKVRSLNNINSNYRKIWLCNHCSVICFLIG